MCGGGAREGVERRRPLHLRGELSAGVGLGPAVTESGGVGGRPWEPRRAESRRAARWESNLRRNGPDVWGERTERLKCGCKGRQGEAAAGKGLE